MIGDPSYLPDGLAEGCKARRGHETASPGQRVRDQPSVHSL
jgi:hypothetical protein